MLTFCVNRMRVEFEKHSRTSPDVQLKDFSLTTQKTRPRTDYEWTGETVQNFCSNTFSSLYFKFRAKKFHAAKSLVFSLHFLLQRDQNHYSNLTSKIIKMCEQILKKDSAPIQFKFCEFQKTDKSS